MSDPGSAGNETTVPTKKKVSPARNVIGLIVLIVMIAIGWFQYSAVIGYNAAVKAMDARTTAEDKDLMSVQEAETLLGKAPDGPGTDFQEGNRSFTTKTYSWWGPLKSYTLTAFYTKGASPYLHHFETEGAKLPQEKVMPIDFATIKAEGGGAGRPGGGPGPGMGGPRRGGGKGAGAKKKAADSADAVKSDASKPAATEKAADAKPGPDASKSEAAKGDAGKGASKKDADKEDAPKDAPK
jgi:hypothetical protein